METMKIDKIDELFENLNTRSNAELFCLFGILLERETDPHTKNLLKLFNELFCRVWYIEDEKRKAEVLYGK